MNILKSQIVILKKEKTHCRWTYITFGVSFGHNCFVGPFTEIQKNVKIGNNTKNYHSFICELVEISNNVSLVMGSFY